MILINYNNISKKSYYICIYLFYFEASKTYTNTPRFVLVCSCSRQHAADDVKRRSWNVQCFCLCRDPSSDPCRSLLLWMACLSTFLNYKEKWEWTLLSIKCYCIIALIRDRFLRNVFKVMLHYKCYFM